MSFSKELKQAMQQLNINQAQVVSMTGIGKSSISQYLSGKNVPTEERQKNIAVSLGLESNYFEQEESVEKQIKPTESNEVFNVPVELAAKLMHKKNKFVYDGLQEGAFPWGYAVKTSSKWSYYISSARFEQETGIKIQMEKGA